MVEYLTKLIATGHALKKLPLLSILYSTMRYKDIISALNSDDGQLQHTTIHEQTLSTTNNY